MTQFFLFPSWEHLLKLYTVKNLLLQLFQFFKSETLATTQLEAMPSDLIFAADEDSTLTSWYFTP